MLNPHCTLQRNKDGLGRSGLKEYQQCNPDHCKNCGWNVAEDQRRREVIRATGLEEQADGTWGLVIRRNPAAEERARMLASATAKLKSASKQTIGKVLRVLRKEAE